MDYSDGGSSLITQLSLERCRSSAVHERHDTSLRRARDATVMASSSLVAPLAAARSSPRKTRSLASSSRTRVLVAPVRAAAAPAGAAAETCDLAEGAALVDGKSIRASAFRELAVMNPAGETVRLGDALGDDRSVLVLLRHLG